MSKSSIFLIYLLLISPAVAELTPGTPAPEFPKDAIWYNSQTPPPTMADLKAKHKVVLIDFWEYTCINCVRTFPHLKEWYSRYHQVGNTGLEIVGVQKGEFGFASIPENTKVAYQRFQLPYPIIADSTSRIWKAYDSNSWPNSFLIDSQGVIRVVHQGEGDYGKFEREIQTLLKQADPSLDFSKLPIAADTALFGPACGHQSEEIYVGYERGNQWGGKIANSEGFRPNQVVSYAKTSTRVPRGFFVQGDWKNRPDDFEAVSSSTPLKPTELGISYQGREVYVVLDQEKIPTGAGSELVVTRDGKPIPPALQGKDIHLNAKGQTVISVKEPRMYYVIQKEDSGQHELTFIPQAAGIRICSFTFGNLCLENFPHL